MRPDGVCPTSAPDVDRAGILGVASEMPIRSASGAGRVAHAGVDVTTGNRPKMLMVVRNPTPRMNEQYGADEAKLSEIAADVAETWS